LPPREGADLARVLLDRADDDVTLVRRVVEEEDIADAIVGFHAQQAVEKAIKAVLAAHGVEYAKRISSPTSSTCWRRTRSTLREPCWRQTS
jgi:HEPN domain-containing protein